MNYKETYQQWLNFDEETRKELLEINNEKEIEDRFYKDLAFGTGGLRGLMGAGPNRINSYTVRKVTYGLAQYIRENFQNNPSVVIAYDTRNGSKEFANDAAAVFCASGIKTFLFEEVAPTPVLSFAVRHLNASAGIVITASHNPKEYNGYKVYNQYGGQLVPSEANEVIKCINDVKSFDSIPTSDLEIDKKNGQLKLIGSELLESFLLEASKQSIHENKANNLKVVYTPLHGAGNIPVRNILKDFNVSVVHEQELPDGNFPTVHSPNPEERDALTIAIQQAKVEDADIVIGTDPDCDRIGVAIKHNGNYELLSGNQIGALLVDFVLKNREITKKSTLIKTIVTNDLGADIALKHGLNVLNTLTGFKYIGDKITEFEHTGEQEFVIGYEESYGYLVGTHARDKDAVVAALLICEMANAYKNKGFTLLDQLEEIYNEYGFYLDALDSFTLKGIEGSKKIKQLMIDIKTLEEGFIPDTSVFLDYNKGIDGLPKEDVLKFILNDGSWIAVRPSGTEPKIKVYYSIKAEDKNNAQVKLTSIKKIIEAKILE
ncbi:phospho-sugar mutase [Carnobacterium inhibens]|uniref:Phosphoglucomutase n=1 Tax=Carnobacterium inhibens subsp. gilichinskyi TaxID=1266845 RepID=U5S9L6_9LACT|nr:phospho-sugar mutase [Carnobacterium inhibens]AGY81945.1 phosphoglucomutase [Carnobacterium inhibens subsp. gilichinskyi]